MPETLGIGIKVISEPTGVTVIAALPPASASSAIGLLIVGGRLRSWLSRSMSLRRCPGQFPAA